MYKVVAEFFDLTDNGKRYVPGDTFPRDGLTVSEARLAELLTANNRLGYPVIERIEQKPARKRVAHDVG